MSQQNVEVAHETMDAFDRRDRAAWLALRDPDYEVIPTAMWPEVGEIRGREAAWDFYMQVVEPFERRPAAPDTEVVEAPPDKVLLHHRMRMRGRASGAEVELDYWVLVAFREGRILRDEWFAHRTEALKAAGLQE